jgi:hypothetical protein
VAVVAVALLQAELEQVEEVQADCYLDLAYR